MQTESPRKGKKYPNEILSKYQMNKLLDAADRGTPSTRRNVVMFATMYRCGLRSDEVRSLKVQDIDFEDGIIHILHGKRDQDRKVACDAKLLEMLREYASNRVGDGEYFFCNQNGKKLCQQYMNKEVKRAASDAKIRKRVAPHTFRHTHAFELLKEGKNPIVIKQQLGHADLKTTMAYLDHLHPKERFDQMREREW